MNSQDEQIFQHAQIHCALQKLDSEVQILQSKVDDVLHILTDKVQVDCKKMGNHILFVESVYEKIRNPLSYICGKIANLSSQSNVELPKIEHSSLLKGQANF